MAGNLPRGKKAPVPMVYWMKELGFEGLTAKNSNHGVSKGTFFPNANPPRNKALFLGGY